MLNLKAELNNELIEDLCLGQWVELNGELVVMRDAAHKRLLSSANPQKEIGFDLNGKIVFYAGPTAGLTSGRGVIGPTTSSRMDGFVEPMLKLGVKGFLGKGPRSEPVKELLAKYKAVYFVTVGGAAAVLSQYVRGAKVIAYPDLGPEAIYLITVQNFPAIVAIDSNGRSI